MKMQERESFDDFKQRFDLVQYALDQHGGRKSGRGVLIKCPFHNDNEPSMYVTQDFAYCFSCGAKKDAIDMLHEVENIPYKDITERTVRYTYQPSCHVDEPKILSRPPSEHFVNVAHAALMDSPVGLDYIMKQRGISRAVIMQYKIGLITPPFRKYTMPRIAFPIWDKNGNLTSITYRQHPGFEYKDEYPDNKRYVIHAGTHAELYNINNVSDRDSILYVGGQIDALTLIQYGVPAVGSSGEVNFKSSWTEYFANKNLYVLLDNDEAGRAGSQKVAEYVPHAKILQWPSWSPDGCDINSFVTDKQYGISNFRRIIGSLV